MRAQRAAWHEQGVVASFAVVHSKETAAGKTLKLCLLNLKSCGGGGTMAWLESEWVCGGAKSRFEGDDGGRGTRGVEVSATKRSGFSHQQPSHGVVL